MAKGDVTIHNDSTPRASLGNDEADHAGACFSPLKSPQDIGALVEHAREKGLSLDGPDEERFRAVIKRVGYFRLKGYCLTLLRNGAFICGTSVEQIEEIIRLDQELALFILQCLAPIEIALRAALCHYLAERYGANALHDADVFANDRDFQKLQDILDREARQAVRAKKPFAIHQMEKYGQLHIWAEVENMSFGTLSRVYENLASKEAAAAIARSVGVPRSHLQSWFRCLTQIRNTCAHYDRVYNRMFVYAPKLFKEHRGIDRARLFPVFIVLFRLLDSVDAQQANVMRRRLGRIVDGHPNVDLGPVGFPSDWRSVLRIPEPSLRDIARPRGRLGGRPAKSADRVEEAYYLYDLRQDSVAEIARRCGMSVSTLYRYIRLRDEEE